MKKISLKFLFSFTILSILFAGSLQNSLKISYANDAPKYNADVEQKAFVYNLPISGWADSDDSNKIWKVRFATITTGRQIVTTCQYFDTSSQDQEYVRWAYLDSAGNLINPYFDGNYSNDYTEMIYSGSQISPMYAEKIGLEDTACWY